MNSKVRTVVVEDQPIVWDYIRSIIGDKCEILDFCTSTQEAEFSIKKYKPEFVWLDCYLGEFADNNQGIKNSGLQIAHWIKNHLPKTKIFLFTASNEIIILKQCQNIGVEGIALSGKYINDKKIVRAGIDKVLAGETWVSPQVLESYEFKDFYKISVFEFAVISTLVLGKTTAQIAQDMSTTRKKVNNAVYRAQQKLFLDPELSREDFLELFKEKVLSSFAPSRFYNLSEVVSINCLVQEFLEPILEKLKTEKLAKKSLSIAC